MGKATSVQAAPSLSDARIYGVDFTSTPSTRKTITIAQIVPLPAETSGDAAQCFSLIDMVRCSNWQSFEAFLAQPGPWIAAFDFPFGLPRELVLSLAQTHGWPTNWEGVVRHCAVQERAALREQFMAFCAARAVGNKFAHRATDLPAGSSPSMKWVNPPVAWMYHAGVPRLLSAGVTLTGLHAGDPQRIALEAYPGMLARSITRASYKADDKKRQTPEREAERETIVAALERGQYKLGLPIIIPAALRRQLVAEPGADLLDAVLCATQAAWAWQRRACHYGLPTRIDALEGWIVGA